TDAATAVTSPRSKVQSPKLNPDPRTLDVLQSLVDKSLLQSGGLEMLPPPNDEPRFVMLATLREYALEQLESSGEAVTIRRRHAHVLLEMAEEAEPNLRNADRGRWVARLETERDNLRAALSWLLTTGDAGTGVRLAAALGPFW